MKEAFDHIWLHIVLVKPPWNLYDILRCVEKHWIAVFGYKYPKDLQSKFDHLKNLWKASKAAPSLNDNQRDSLIQTAVSILQAIQKVRHELGRVVNECVYSLQVSYFQLVYRSMKLIFEFLKLRVCIIQEN